MIGSKRHSGKWDKFEVQVSFLLHIFNRAVLYYSSLGIFGCFQDLPLRMNDNTLEYAAAVVAALYNVICLCSNISMTMNRTAKPKHVMRPNFLLYRTMPWGSFASLPQKGT